jgi:hypothetical protein
MSSTFLKSSCVLASLVLASGCDPADQPERAGVEAFPHPQVIVVEPGDPPVDEAELDGALHVVEWTPDERLDLAVAGEADPDAVCVWYPIAYDVWGPYECGSCTLYGAPAALYEVFMKDCSTCGACGAPYIRTSCKPC